MATRAKQTPAEIVVEPESSLVLTQVQPGLAILGNFEALQAFVDRTVADYVGVTVTDEYVPQAKHDRAALNGLVKDIDARRLEVKRQFMAPITEFEDRIKSILAPAKEASAAIDVQIKDFEEREKNAKRAELVKHWTEYAGALADAVSFEQIEDPKWSLKSTNLMACFEAIESRVDKIAADYEALMALDLPHIEDARAEFIATLDFGKAVARNKEIAERLARQAELEAQRQAFIAEQKAATASVVQEAEQIAAQAAPSVAVSEVILGAGDPVEIRVTSTSTPIPETYDWSVTFHGTRAQAEAVAAYCKSLGITGKVVRS